jgi:hypothetical protein
MMSRNTLTVPGLLCTLVFALAACSITIGERREDPVAGASPLSPTPDAESPSGAPPTIDAPGRLAVVGADGRLATMRPDGSGLVEMPALGGPALQPAWSPTGDRLAWVVQRTSDTGVGGAIAVAGPRGQRASITRTPFVPYYLSWDPSGDRVAFLGAGGDPAAPVQMGVLDLTREPARTSTVAGGSPFFYFAWAPDGRRVLAHAGFDRLEEVGLSGRTTPVSQRPGLFATPAWSADGRTVVYAERGASATQRLVAIVDDDRPRVLLQGRGAISFVLRPDGEAVAYQLLGRDDDDLYDRRATLPGDGVRVVDVRTGITRRATSMRAMTFWWSPDGERLLALAPEPEAPGTIPFLWQVWSGGRTSEVAGSHSPTIEVLRDYAPFFTQYAQSTTPWAPDGSAFAFAAEGPGGTGQIVVQEVGGDPVAIAPGVFVTWSPS